MENKNKELLESFSEYCIAHPEQRFFQALRNWVGVGYIFTADERPEDMSKLTDTFYHNNKND